MTKKTLPLEHILPTGMTRCYDADGKLIDCAGSGQDAASQHGGSPVVWTADRFTVLDELLVQDNTTRLIWSKNSCPTEYPLNWQESLAYIKEMNDTAAGGRTDWRMPNRRELRSLIDHSTRNPALPLGHPSSRSISAGSGRRQPRPCSPVCLVCPSCRRQDVLRQQRWLLLGLAGMRQSDSPCRTGAKSCYDKEGYRIACEDSGQDGALQMGAAGPKPRFVKVQMECLIC